MTRRSQTLSGRSLNPAAVRAAAAALAWAVVFLFFNIYWYVGGTLANPGALPDPTPNSLAGWTFEMLVSASFVVGIAICLAVARGRLRAATRWLVLALAWAGCVLLVARGGAGVIDDLARASGLLPNGLTGLSLEEAIGTAHPSALLRWTGYGIDAYFLLGGLLFGVMAIMARRAERRL